MKTRSKLTIWNSFLEHSLTRSHELHCDIQTWVLQSSVCDDSPLHEFDGQSRFLVLFPPPHVFEQSDHFIHKSKSQNVSLTQDSVRVSFWFKAGYSFRQSSLSTCWFCWIQLRVTIFSPEPQVFEQAPLVQSSQNGQLSSDINACVFCKLLEQINVCWTPSSWTCWILRSYSFS